MQLESFVWLERSGISCASLSDQLCKRRGRWMWKAWPIGVSSWAPSGREAPSEGSFAARRYIVCSLSANVQYRTHITTWMIISSISCTVYELTKVSEEKKKYYIRVELSIDVIACRSRRDGTKVSSILAAKERQVTASSCIAHPSSCCIE